MSHILSQPGRPAWVLRMFIGPVLRYASAYIRYGVAVLITLAVMMGRTLLDPMVGHSAPLLPLVSAVLLTASLAGRGPALFATLLAPAVLTVLLVYAGWIDQWGSWLAHVVLFIVNSVVIILVMGALQQAQYLAATQEAQLRLIADSVPVLMAYVDQEHRYQFVNRQYEEWFGLPTTDVLNRHVREVLGGELYVQIRPHMMEALLGRAVRFEMRLPHQDAAEHVVRAHYVPHFAEDRTVLGFFAVIAEITDLRRGEQQLSEMQQRLSMALRAGRAGTFEWDVPHGVTHWSDELVDLYGFKRSEVAYTYEGWLKCVLPEDRALLACSAQEILKRGEQRAEFQIRRHDTGELRWIQARGKVIYSPEGEPIRVVGVNSDITEHKLATEALRDRECKLRLIYNNTSDALLLLRLEEDGSCRIVSSNATFLKWMQLDRAQVEGRVFADFFALERARAIANHCRELIRAKSRLTLQESIELHDETRFVEVSLVAIQSAVPSERLHLLAALTDVTAARKAEEALRCEARRKDEFLAMLAHELRNPLAPIRNVAHVMQHRTLDREGSRQFGAMVERQVSHLARMVEDLLDVSRITRGVITLRRELLNLESVIRTAIEMITPALQSKQQRVNDPVIMQAFRVHGDPARLTQVFANLLSNASKYSPLGSEIALFVERHESQVVVRVRDRGVGIDRQMLPQIFDLFVQADRSLDRRESGLGIGLTVAQRLVQLHEGRIEAASAGLGYGSEFSVHLPLAIVEDMSTDARSGSGISVHRVLIVDDNSDVALSLSSLLGAEGYQVRIAHDGATALALIEVYDPHVILLDIGLPDIDGYLVAQTIRQRFPGRSMSICAVTGYGTPQDRAQALGSGFDHHIVKPVAPQELLQLLARECNPTQHPPREIT